MKQFSSRCFLYLVFAHAFTACMVAPERTQAPTRESPALVAQSGWTSPEEPSTRIEKLNDRYSFYRGDEKLADIVSYQGGASKIFADNTIVHCDEHGIHHHDGHEWTVESWSRVISQENRFSDCQFVGESWDDLWILANNQACHRSDAWECLQTGHEFYSEIFVTQNHVWLGNVSRVDVYPRRGLRREHSIRRPYDHDREIASEVEDAMVFGRDGYPDQPATVTILRADGSVETYALEDVEEFELHTVSSGRVFLTTLTNDGGRSCPVLRYGESACEPYFTWWTQLVVHDAIENRELGHLNLRGLRAFHFFEDPISHEPLWLSDGEVYRLP